MKSSLFAIPLSATLFALGCARPAPLPPPAAGTARHFVGEGRERFAVDLPTGASVEKPWGEFTLPNGGRVHVVYGSGGEDADALAKEALHPTITRSKPPWTTVRFEPLIEGGERGYYRVLTMKSKRERLLHDVTATLSDGKTVRSAVFTGRPDPTREEALAILRSLRPAPE